MHQVLYCIHTYIYPTSLFQLEIFLENHILSRLKSDRVYVDCKQEKEGDNEDGILIRSVKGNHQVESHLPSFQFRDLTMNEFCVGLVENNNR